MDRSDNQERLIPLGELCEFLTFSRDRRQADVPSRTYPVIRAADLFKEALEATAMTLPQPPIRAERHQIQPGDILVPRITRRPCARLAGVPLAGCIPLDSVVLIRPRSNGPTPQELADFLSSGQFFEHMKSVSSRLGDALRYSMEDLRRVPYAYHPLERAARGKVVQLMDRLARDLIRVLAEDQTELWNIEWRVLEHVIATAFEGLGFEVELTPPSKDGGKDIVLTCWESGARNRFAVEIKHWTSGKRVGGTDLRQFLEVVVADNFDLGLLLSTSGYSMNAAQGLQYLEHRRLRVAGANKIAGLCKMFVQGESGLWLPRGEPREGLLDRTFCADLAHHVSPMVRERT